MFKKQLTLQKIVCLLALVASALVFIYSLGIMTDLYDCLYSTMRDPNDVTQTSVPGSIVYYNMQGFNGSFMDISIGLILLACLLFITNTHSRRIYYVGNYIANVLFVAASAATAVWAHIQIEAYRAEFLQVDFAALKEHSELWKTAYTESTFWFDIHYGVFAVLLVACLLLIGNMIWKTKLVKEEKKLVETGKEVAV